MLRKMINLSSNPLNLEPKVVDEVFKNLGAWGADGNPKEIKCDVWLNKIIFFIDSDSLAFLNLSKIKIFLKSGEDIIGSDRVLSVNLSSNYCEEDNQDESEQLVNGGPFHTRKEVRPYIEFIFKTPLQVKEIFIHNRADKFGYRANFIAVDGFLDGQKNLSFMNVSNEERLKLANELENFLYEKVGIYKFPVHGLFLGEYIREIIYIWQKYGDGSLSKELISAL